MFFKSFLRYNPSIHAVASYYRIVESYRNELGRVCYTTFLNVGFIDYSIETLNIICKILNNKESFSEELFETTDEVAIKMANYYWAEMIKKGKIDISLQGQEKKKRLIDVDTIKHKDAREIGSEWLCYQALQQLNIPQKLKELGWSIEAIQLALTQIVSRAVYPFSEARTSNWIKDNSAICEITGFPIEKISKDKLYKSALKLYEIKEQLEQYLSTRTNELFDLEDKIIIYDLTNTYFEGRKKNSKLANFGRSKEKRSDAKIIVLAMVVNEQGFTKYSNIFEGNTSDSNTLPKIIDELRIKTSDEKRATIVLDAGIATKANLEIIAKKGYKYICVSRSKIKNYSIDESGEIVNQSTKNGYQVRLQKVKSETETDYILKINSPMKKQKEDSMRSKLEERFITELSKIELSLSKKNGIKTLDKVNQRIGRAIEKYPSIAKFYNIKVVSENNKATKLEIEKKGSSEKNELERGIYFIRTNMQTETEQTIWCIYNTIREIESSFRCLKTDLDLRPIYHKNDNATMAHLHLGILAYWLVNTIRYQLKCKKINISWQEIMRISSIQKMITTQGQNTYDEIVQVRKCTEPTEKVKTLYNALNYKNYPFTKRKLVGHKPKLKKNETPISSKFQSN